jgi:hypothetical protein
MSGWLLMLLGTVFGALAIQEWTFDSGLVPVAIGLFQLSVALPLVLYTLNGSARTEEQNFNRTRPDARRADATGGEQRTGREFPLPARDGNEHDRSYSE